MKSTLHPFHTDDARLRAVHEKVASGAALAQRDVEALYASKDILAIGWLANFVRERLHGNVTNCVVNTVLEEAAASNAPEVVIVEGGEDSLQRIARARRQFPQASISGSTAEELATQSDLLSAARQLREAGATSLIGGGAEVFTTGVRQQFWGRSTPWQRRAEAREAAMQAGLRVPLYLVDRGSSAEDQAAELLNLAVYKSDSFATLTFDPGATTSVSIPVTTGMQEMKQVAIARLALPQVQHIRVYWQMLGAKLAQIALRFGASEVDGTPLDPNVNPEFRRRELMREVAAAGREPKEIPGVRKLVLGR